MPPAPCAGSYIISIADRGLTPPGYRIPPAQARVLIFGGQSPRNSQIRMSEFVPRTRLFFCGKLSLFGVKSEPTERPVKLSAFDRPTRGTPAFVQGRKSRVEVRVTLVPPWWRLRVSSRIIEWTFTSVTEKETKQCYNQKR